MTHRAYVNFWAVGDSDFVLLNRFERLLDTVPLSVAQPGFNRLLIRAVNPSEAPLVEHDLRGSRSTAADVIALARDYSDPDTEYELETQWDLWQPDDNGVWSREPAPLLLLSRGPLYDDGIAIQSGQFEADLGFESLFTGGDQSAPGHAEPADGLQNVGQNVKQLFDWLRRAESAVPLERYQLWSEGEENLEARLDDILSLH